MVIVALLFWYLRESQANPFLGIWLSQHFPIATFLLDPGVVYSISGLLIVSMTIFVLRQGREHATTEKTVKSPRFRLARPGYHRLITIMITVGGLAVLGLGGIRGSVSLVAVGFGLLFWGNVLLPRKASTLNRALDNTAVTSITRTLDMLMSDLASQKEPIYAPRKLDSRELRVSLVIFRGPPPVSQSSMSREANLRQIDFLPAPGEGLLQLVEQKVKVDFSEVPLGKLPELLRKGIIDKLKLASDFEYNSTGPISHFRIFNCQYSDVCKGVSGVSHVASHIGCPLCSMIASALVKSSAHPVSIESSVVSANGAVMDLTFRLLESEEQLEHMPPLDL